MPAKPKAPASCPVCASVEPHTIDRFLCMPDDWTGKRGPRSLAGVFGLDRRDIAKHERTCLVDERRRRVEEDLQRMAGTEEGGVRRG